MSNTESAHSMMRRAMAAASISATLAILPVFLLGGVAVEVQTDLGVDEVGIGALSAIFWAAMALSGVPGGRSAELLGPTMMTRIGAGLAGLSLLGTGLATSVGILVVSMVLGGVASGLLNPATDLTLATSVPASRRGLAFGLKQGAVPFATVFAGLGVSVVAQTVGWRWAFIGATAIAPVVAGVMPRVPRTGSVERTDRGARRPHRSVPRFAMAAGAGMAAMTATGAFYVSSAVDNGTPAVTAGAFLTIASLVGAGSRFWFAWRRGDHPRPYAVSAVLIALGAVGTAGFAAGATGGVLLVATVLVFGAGWGWNALFVLALVRDNPRQPATAMGYIVSATGAGGVVGPLVFAWTASGLGTSVAWALATALHVTSMLLILSGERMLDADRAATPAGTGRTTGGSGT